MAHCITALIGSPRALASLVERFGPPRPTKLHFGLVIVPLNERRLDLIASSTDPPLHGFTYLTSAMATEIGKMIADGRALYIETEYFGGEGGQGAVLFEDGKMTWRAAEPAFDTAAPKSRMARLLGRPLPRSKSPISEGLSRLGIARSIEQDEFDQVGLRRFRSLEALGLDSDG